MIEVIEERKIPFYEVECYECKSKLRYTRKDVSLLHITCPVCGVSVSVIPTEGSEAGYYGRLEQSMRADLNSLRNVVMAAGEPD